VKASIAHLIGPSSPYSLVTIATLPVPIINIGANVKTAKVNESFLAQKHTDLNFSCLTKPKIVNTFEGMRKQGKMLCVGIVRSIANALSEPG
jgi:hypothetical protein